MYNIVFKTEFTCVAKINYACVLRLDFRYVCSLMGSEKEEKKFKLKKEKRFHVPDKKAVALNYETSLSSAYTKTKTVICW